MLTRVVFRFPTDMVIRYVERPPLRGETILGMRGEELVVLEMEPDGSGGYYVSCVTPERYAREMTLARRLLARAREVQTKALDLGRKRQRDHR